MPVIVVKECGEIHQVVGQTVRLEAEGGGFHDFREPQKPQDERALLGQRKRGEIYRPWSGGGIWTPCFSASLKTLHTRAWAYWT